MCWACGKEGHFKLVCQGALIHRDGRPEVHIMRMETHEITFTRDPEFSFRMIFSCDKALKLVYTIMEINGTPLKRMMC